MHALRGIIGGRQFAQQRLTERSIFDAPNERPSIHGQATHRLLLAKRRIDLAQRRECRRSGWHRNDFHTLGGKAEVLSLLMQAKSLVDLVRTADNVGISWPEPKVQSATPLG